MPSLHEQAAEGLGGGEAGPVTIFPLVVLSPEASGSSLAAQHSLLMREVLLKAWSPDPHKTSRGYLLGMQIPGFPPPSPAESETLGWGPAAPK